MIPSAVLNWADLAKKYTVENKTQADLNRFNPAFPILLDVEDILAIIWNESSGNPNAENPGDPSWGLMGVTFPIGKAFGGVETPTALFDPETNIRSGSGFLAHLKMRFLTEFPDTWSDAYNEGETKLAKGIVLTPGYSASFREHVVELKGQLI